MSLQSVSDTFAHPPYIQLESIQLPWKFAWERLGHIRQTFEWFTLSKDRVILWDIDRAISLSAGRVDGTIPLPTVAEALKLNWGIVTGMDPEYAMTTDLSAPIINVCIYNPVDQEKRNVIIDGWHRLMKAMLTGTEPPYVTLTETEEAACRCYDVVLL